MNVLLISGLNHLFLISSLSQALVSKSAVMTMNPWSPSDQENEHLDDI